MNALLDTHALLWLADDPQRLPAPIVALCEDETNDLNVSIASFWELTIKMSLCKITLSEDALPRLSRWCHDNAIRILPIELNHLAQLQTLPFHHRDPFDRLLIAQAQSENMPIISVDEHFAAYDVDGRAQKPSATP